MPPRGRIVPGGSSRPSQHALRVRAQHAKPTPGDIPDSQGPLLPRPQPGIRHEPNIESVSRIRDLPSDLFHVIPGRHRRGMPRDLSNHLDTPCGIIDPVPAPHRPTEESGQRDDRSLLRTRRDAQPMDVPLDLRMGQLTEHAVELGVPPDAILQETQATNTGENFTFTKRLLASRGIDARSATIISRPYQQRRAYATASKLWPGLVLVCSSCPQGLGNYIDRIGDSDRVLNMLVGDTQLILTHADAGFAEPQRVDTTTLDAFKRLVEAGYAKRLISSSKGK